MILLLLACAGPGTGPPADVGSPVWVEARKVDSGKPVRIHAPDDATFVVTPPIAAPVDAGDGVWELKTEDGSYIVAVTLPGKEAPTALYLDVGKDGPSGGKMEDLAGLPPPPPPIWPYILAAAVGVLAIIGAWLGLRRLMRKAPAPPPPEPADARARREWKELRARDDLSHEELARQLSAVYRRYVEATHGWPATQRTTRENLDNLAGELTAAQLECARHLLMAMDLVKFAEREARAELFDALDRDFDQLVRRA